MTQQEILDSSISKTEKMLRLFELGLNRRQVATLMGVGYGFVQNVYARRYGTSRTNHRALSEVLEEAEFRLQNFVFNHTFGIEIEAVGISRTELREELSAAGIQVTCEGYNHATRNYWKIVSDGSLRGDMPFELVSPKLQGEEGLRQLKTVCLILKGLETKTNKSCGLHIHFDTADFDTKTWKNIFKNYAKIEPEIDRFMPASRRGSQNGYCRSVRVEGFEQRIDGVSDLASCEEAVRQLGSRLFNNDRYFKVNCQAYWRHRSIEFRQHSGSVNEKKIKNWILFLARLIEYSKQASFRTADRSTLRNFLNEELINFYERRAQELAA